jgi:ACT domain-containing protein
MSGSQAGKALLEFRRAGRSDDFGKFFLLFLDQGRSKREILNLLRVIGLPFLQSEVSVIGDIIAGEIPSEVRERNAVEHGYSVECHATPNTRISIVFLSKEERSVYKKHFVQGENLTDPMEERIFAELEGRLCVWARHGKIHLGGPRFVFERVARIILSNLESSMIEVEAMSTELGIDIMISFLFHFDANTEPQCLTIIRTPVYEDSMAEEEKGASFKTDEETGVREIIEEIHSKGKILSFKTKKRRYNFNLSRIGKKELMDLWNAIEAINFDNKIKILRQDG